MHSSTDTHPLKRAHGFICDLNKTQKRLWILRQHNRDWIRKKWRCWFFVIFLYAALFICSDFDLSTTKAAKKCDPFHTYLLVKISVLCSFLSRFLSICLNKKKMCKNVWWISVAHISYGWLKECISWLNSSNWCENKTKIILKFYSSNSNTKNISSGEDAAHIAILFAHGDYYHFNYFWRTIVKRFTLTSWTSVVICG